MLSREKNSRAVPVVAAGFLFFASSVWALEAYRITSSSKKIPGTSLKLVTSKAYFPKRPELLWSLLNRPEEFPSYIPRITTCESHGMVRGKEHIYVVMDLPWPLPDLWNVVAVSRDPDQRRFSWEMVDGNMRANSGKLTIEADPAGSVVLVELTTDPGLFLPSWIVTWGAKSFLPKVLRSIGKRLEQEEKKPPLPTVTPVISSTPIATPVSTP